MANCTPNPQITVGLDPLGKFRYTAGRVTRQVRVRPLDTLRRLGAFWAPMTDASLPPLNQGTAHADGLMLPPGTVAPQQRRRARRYFTLSFLACLFLALWLLTDFVLPDANKAALSARPAPAPSLIMTYWHEMAPMHRRNRTVTMKKNDSLAALLTREGIGPIAADAALDTLQQVFDPRGLKPGQKVRIFTEWPQDSDPDSQIGRFAGFDLIPSPRQRIILRRTGHLTFDIIDQTRPLSDRYFVADALITSSVYEAARSSGMAPSLVVDMIRLFSFNIDFQRDIREGDQLEVLYSRRFDGGNQLAEEGDILYAALTNRGKRHAYWRLEHDDGNAAFYDETGKSVQRLLMKTPVDGARLSSRFGMRRHPILGYTRLHRGLDFAAPTGTPIYAAGNGVIEKVTRSREYGRFIRLQHSNGYETVYAHLSRFARGLKANAKVRQGQIIGFVGMSGLATGPHLHYEVLHYGKPVNPRTLDLPPGRKLDENGLVALQTAIAGAQKRISSLAARDNTLRSLPRRSRASLSERQAAPSRFAVPTARP